MTECVLVGRQASERLQFNMAHRKIHIQRTTIKVQQEKETYISNQCEENGNEMEFIVCTTVHRRHRLRLAIMLHIWLTNVPKSNIVEVKGEGSLRREQDEGDKGKDTTIFGHAHVHTYAYISQEDAIPNINCQIYGISEKGKHTHMYTALKWEYGHLWFVVFILSCRLSFALSLVLSFTHSFSCLLLNSPYLNIIIKSKESDLRCVQEKCFRSKLIQKDEDDDKLQC